MPSAVVLGANSDIAKELTVRLHVDGWTVHGWKRGDLIPECEWSLLVCAVGVLNPIGLTMSVNPEAWAANVMSNAMLPIAFLQQIWPHKAKNASVCFFSGAGVSRPAPSYSAYAASKAMLMKMTELLDDEYPEDKFFILGPGMVKTKIQHQTIDAGPLNAANYERVAKFLNDADGQHGKGTSHDRIYECLKWCIAQPKNVVGGRNFYVPSMEWGDQTAPILAANRDMFKLRRFGGGL